MSESYGYASMGYIEAAEQAVLRNFGPGYEEIAACAAVAARIATIGEMERAAEEEGRT